MTGGLVISGRESAGRAVSGRLGDDVRGEGAEKRERESSSISAPGPRPPEMGEIG